MKKLLLFSVLVGSICFSTKANAQVRINVNLGGGSYSQPYNNNAYCSDQDYYYMPEVGAYYNVNRNLYFYQDGGNWRSGAHLPGRYNGYTYNSGQYYRIHDRMPFMNDDRYRNQYAGNYGRSNYENRGGFEHRNRNYNNGGGYNNGEQRDGGGRNYGGGQPNGNYNHGYNGGQQNGGGHNFGGNQDRRW